MGLRKCLNIPNSLDSFTTLAFPYCQLAAQNICKLLEDPTRLDEAAAVLTVPPFAAADFKGEPRTYSDADSE